MRGSRFARNAAFADFEPPRSPRDSHFPANVRGFIGEAEPTRHYSRKHGFTARLRTLNAIQLAMALDLSDRGLVDRFVVADKVLARVTAREGLPAINPEPP